MLATTIGTVHTSSTIKHSFVTNKKVQLKLLMRNHRKFFAIEKISKIWHFKAFEVKYIMV